MFIRMKRIFIVVLTAIITFGVSNQVYAKDSYSISRIIGINRYETSVNISNGFSNGIVQNIIIASGNDFPDALSISSIAASKGYPVLMSDKTNLPNEIKDTKYESWSYFDLTLKDGKVIEMHQEYRP
ncbi:N-acetylmuramoyl-L-alanine amidase LytC precursor [Clostridium liquoris]|uniref:N-acetylmuramoyl-L-alanine amidase LytC n=1 Tax=Clostridium liquoris TaxID=1289519 RepID=A0A2T0B5Y0_9CLOT|nr:cell wall-binding repeat-containing protein [Clostridium liquoris]PRR79308.1 N-acetylmuramoyl-L-alanine amidase LytC precursor [Clostridium liquoris]